VSRSADWRVAGRFAARELRGGLKTGLQGFWVFLICLMLGVAAIAAVGTVRDGISGGLAREGAVLLGGDAELRFTYRTATEDERAWMGSQAAALSEVIDFRSLVRIDGDVPDQALTQVLAVDGGYPLTGALELDPPMPIDQALGDASGPEAAPGAVMDPVLADRLGLAIGDRFRLGEQVFTLAARITLQPDAAGSRFSLGPRTIVRTEALAASGLITPGSLFESRYRMTLPDGADLAALERATEARFADSGVRWRDRRNGAPGLARFVDRLSAFLVLVGLAGLAVGGVGVSAAVRAYLDTKVPVIATLKTLGASGRTLFAIYMIQIGVLALLGIFAGLVLGAVLPLLAAPMIEARLPMPAAFRLAPGPLAEAALYGVLTALMFTLWPLARAERIRPAALYRVSDGRGWPRLRWVGLTVLILLAQVASAAWLSGLPRLSVWAAGGLLVAFGTLVGMAMLTRSGARRVAQRPLLRRRPGLRQALGAIGGPGGQAMPVILSLGLGLSVLAAVGQIDTNIRGAIARDLPQVAPSYFVIDIQPDQLPQILARLEEDTGVSRIQTAPMLRGVITRINDRPAAEVAGDHWVLRGDRGVTYSAAPPDGTEITTGEWWPEDYAGAPQVSFAAEEAGEMGLELGDRLTVNILGRDIKATLTSLRVVDFSTAGIGFVMAMNPAALAGAPHTSIATVYAEPQAEAAILRDLSRSYPNVTAIRVRDAIDRVTEVLGTVAAAITYGALATLLTGVAVLIGAAAAGERSRTYEAAILKTLGFSRARILANFALRSAMLGLVAGAVAVLAGGVAGWAVSQFVMEATFRFAPGSALMIVVGGALVTTLAGLAFAWRALSASPARVLRAGE